MKVRVEIRGCPLMSTSRMVARTWTRLRRFSSLTLLLPSGTRTLTRLLPWIENFLEPSQVTRRLRCFFALLLGRLA